MAAKKSQTPSAAGPTAGYVYQLRYALHRALERLRRDPAAAIAVEQLDDITIVKDGVVEEIDQLKHTVNDEQPLTDYSKALCNDNFHVRSSIEVAG